VRNWIGQTKSRSLEMGTVVLISPAESTERESTPSTNDQLCIHVSGEEFPAAFVNASAERLAINMVKGPTIFLEPVLLDILLMANDRNRAFPLRCGK
jgi:hypothetical protein